MTSGERWVLPAGSTGGDGFELVVDDTRDGWHHTGLRVVTLAGSGPDDRVRLPADGWEHLVVPLSGSVRVATAQWQADLAGRESVFAGPTDTAYVPAGHGLELIGLGDPARVAVCSALVPEPADRSPRHLPAAGVPVELRGAGIASREVRDLGGVAVLDADRLIVCEVVTPAGNWSSYPPHKHDEDRPGVESELEEIYYFETRVEGGADRPGADPVGYQRVSGTSERPIEVLAEVRTGDVVLVPHGWHGPSMAAPGYDLYYLNVMAGPGETRAWLISDDPRHGWVRETWPGQRVDPRLPMGGPR